MSAEVAYAPKAAFSDPDCLGAVFVDDTTEVNVRELVQASANGTFVVSNPKVINVLDNYPALKRVAVPDSAPPPEEAGAGVPAQALGGLTKAEMLELPEAAGIEGAKRLTIDELREAVRAARYGG